jgi:hypothetical protein
MIRLWSPCDKGRSQATIDRLEGQLRELKRKSSLYKTRLKVAQLEIAQLKKTIPDVEEQSWLSLPSPHEYIFRNLVNNRQVPLNRRRYSIEALTWGRMIDDTSPAARETVRSMLLWVDWLDLWPLGQGGGLAALLYSSPTSDEDTKIVNWTFNRVNNLFNRSAFLDWQHGVFRFRCSAQNLLSSPWKTESPLVKILNARISEEDEDSVPLPGNGQEKLFKRLMVWLARWTLWQME